MGPTKIENCEFPDDLHYDDEGFVWARFETSGDVLVGITSIYAALAGRPSKVKGKPTGIEYDRGKTIGTLESGKYFGPIRTPVSGILKEVNSAVLANPRLMTDSSYRDGWFARLEPTCVNEDRRVLLSAEAAKPCLTNQIAALHVRCFAAFPEYEMIEIGTECAAVLSKLNELLTRIEIGEVVHIVSDDVTAPIEMVRWSDQTRQPIVDTRTEGNLFHFLVRKVS